MHVIKNGGKLNLMSDFVCIIRRKGLTTKAYGRRHSSETMTLRQRPRSDGGDNKGVSREEKAG